jgi:hypothetical protein
MKLFYFYLLHLSVSISLTGGLKRQKRFKGNIRQTVSIGKNGYLNNNTRYFMIA